MNSKCLKMLGLMLVIVLAFSTAALAQVEIEFWHRYSGYRGELLDQLVQDFNDSQSNIVVNSSYQGNYETMLPKILAAIAGGAAPHAVTIDQFFVGELAEPGALVPLDAMISDELRSDVYEPFWQISTYDDIIYSLPLAMSNVILYYNKDLFDAASLEYPNANWTWEDLQKSAIVLTQDTNGDSRPDIWGYELPFGPNVGGPENTIWLWQNFLWQAGGEFLTDNDTRAGFNTPEGISSLQFLVDLIHKHEAAPAHTDKEGESFMRGIIAMEYNSSSQVGYRDQNASFTVGTSILPEGPARKAANVGGANLALIDTGTAEEQAAAWEFIQYLTGEHAGVIWATENGYIPTRFSTIETESYQEFLKATPNAQAYVDQLPYLEFRPSIPRYSETSAQVYRFIERALSGRLSVEEALAAAEEAVNQVLDTQ